MVSSIQTRQTTINEHSDTDTRGSSCLITSSKATLKHTWNNNILWRLSKVMNVKQPLNLFNCWPTSHFSHERAASRCIFPLGPLMRPRAFWKAPGKKKIRILWFNAWILWRSLGQRTRANTIRHINHLTLFRFRRQIMPKQDWGVFIHISESGLKPTEWLTLTRVICNKEKRKCILY